MQDYELANQEAEKLFTSLGITTTVSAPIADVREDWPSILFNVNFSKCGKNLPIQYRVGVGHVKWPKRFEDIPYGTPSDLIPVFNTLRQNPSATLKNKAEHARAARVLAIAQKVSPKPHQVFTCICEESARAHGQSFQDYCDEMGGNSDSIKEKTVYEFLCEQYHKISAMVNRATISKLAELHGQF